MIITNYEVASKNVVVLIIFRFIRLIGEILENMPFLSHSMTQGGLTLTTDHTK